MSKLSNHPRTKDENSFEDSSLPRSGRITNALEGHLLELIAQNVGTMDQGMQAALAKIIASNESDAVSLAAGKALQEVALHPDVVSLLGIANLHESEVVRQSVQIALSSSKT